MAVTNWATVNASDERTMPVYWRSITSEVEAIGGDERSRLALGLSFREGVLVSDVHVVPICKDVDTEVRRQRREDRASEQ